MSLYLGLEILVVLGVSWWLYNVVYSIFFSPLKSIPSPIELQLFPILLDFSILKGTCHTLVHNYHLKYGPIFRVGWKRVICLDAEAPGEIFKSYKYKKSPIYVAVEYFGVSILSTQDKFHHQARRRFLSPAFTRSRVMSMESTVTEVGIKPLLRNIENQKEFNILNMFHCMSWDIIGELGFGKSFGMLEGGSREPVAWLESVLDFGMACAAFPFLSRFQTQSGEKLRKYQAQLLDDYEASGSRSEANLISHYRNGVDKETGKGLSKDELLSEAHILLFAGTDTVSNSTALLFHLLLTHPSVYQKVKDEVRGAANLSYTAIINEMPYLQAVIKEAMRILPAVAVTLFRVAPKGGSMLMGHYIPEDTEVGSPLYSLHRSPIHWDLPDEFIPERWLAQSVPGIERKMDERCYIPFLVGPRACIGKDLALMELNLLVANLIARFDLQLVHPKLDLDLRVLPILKPHSSSIMVKAKRVLV